MLHIDHNLYGFTVSWQFRFFQFWWGNRVLQFSYNRKIKKIIKSYYNKDNFIDLERAHIPSQDFIVGIWKPRKYEIKLSMQLPPYEAIHPLGQHAEDISEIVQKEKAQQFPGAFFIKEKVYLN